MKKIWWMMLWWLFQVVVGNDYPDWLYFFLLDLVYMYLILYTEKLMWCIFVTWFHIYICIYVYMYVYLYIYIYLYLCIYVYMYVIYIHTYILFCIVTCIFIFLPSLSSNILLNIIYTFYLKKLEKSFDVSLLFPIEIHPNISK